MWFTPRIVKQTEDGELLLILAFPPQMGQKSSGNPLLPVTAHLPQLVPRAASKLKMNDWFNYQGQQPIESNAIGRRLGGIGTLLPGVQIPGPPLTVQIYASNFEPVSSFDKSE